MVDLGGAVLIRQGDIVQQVVVRRFERGGEDLANPRLACVLRGTHPPFSHCIAKEEDNRQNEQDGRWKQDGDERFHQALLCPSSFARFSGTQDALYAPSADQHQQGDAEQRADHQVRHWENEPDPVRHGTAYE